MTEKDLSSVWNPVRKQSQMERRAGAARGSVAGRVNIQTDSRACVISQVSKPNLPSGLFALFSLVLQVP